MERQIWELAFGPSATAFLNDMPEGKMRARIVKKVRTLINNPYQSGCKKLVNVKEGNDDVWRIRLGDYRILYVIREQEVLVIDIGHRQDVYL